MRHDFSTKKVRKLVKTQKFDFLDLKNIYKVSLFRNSKWWKFYFQIGRSHNGDPQSPVFHTFFPWKICCVGLWHIFAFAKYSKGLSLWSILSTIYFENYWLRVNKNFMNRWEYSGDPPLVSFIPKTKIEWRDQPKRYIFFLNLIITCCRNNYSTLI